MHALTPRQLDPTNEVRMVYDMVSRTAKLYGPAEAVGRCAGVMQLVLEGMIMMMMALLIHNCVLNYVLGPYAGST